MDGWDIVRCHYTNERNVLNWWLREGWEPFAVTTQHNGEIVWLRKQVGAEAQPSPEQEAEMEEALDNEVRNQPTRRQRRSRREASET
ncbi:MAG: hypothetical protein ACWGQW_00425 [bacterium]